MSLRIPFFAAMLSYVILGFALGQFLVRGYLTLAAMTVCAIIVLIYMRIKMIRKGYYE